MRNLSNPIKYGIETKQIKLQVEYKGVFLIALRILLVLLAKMTIKNNEIIAEGNNQVTANNDPCGHAEIVAIRNACKKLNDFFLKGCDLYTSCEPCPMCLSAIYWSHVDNIYYANTRIDAKDIDFDDSFIYSEVKKDINDRKIKMIQMNRDEALEAFKIWQTKEDKIKY